MRVNHLLIAFATIGLGFGLDAKAVDHDNATYERIKSSFSESVHCNPLEMTTGIGQPSPMLIRILLQKLGSYDSDYSIREAQALGFDQRFVDDLRYLQQIGNMEQVKVFIIKSVIEIYLQNSSFFDQPSIKSEILSELVENKVFTVKQDDVPECPFVTKDAFLKAVKGHRRILRNRKNISGLRKSDILTIVDYTRPSNERRMFVIDLRQEKVLENTWVAHGHGGIQSNRFAYSVFKGYDASHRGGAAGTDGYGSNAIMSNVHGSNLSSDGFILAAVAGRGRNYGDNIRLEGIDRNNRNIRSRTIIIHKWNTPYTVMTSVPDAREKENVISTLMDYDALRDLPSEASRILRALPYNLGRIHPYMGATQGCFGIPEQLIPRFRALLPGSIIFAYSGSDMSSDYLD